MRLYPSTRKKRTKVRKKSCQNEKRGIEYISEQMFAKRGADRAMREKKDRRDRNSLQEHRRQSRQYAVEIELTAEGRKFCTLAGLIEELLIFLILGIHIRLAILPVVLFLWVLLGILTGAVLIGIYSLLRGTRAGAGYVYYESVAAK